LLSQSAPCASLRCLSLTSFEPGWTLCKVIVCRLWGICSQVEQWSRNNYSQSLAQVELMSALEIYVVRIFETSSAFLLISCICSCLLPAPPARKHFAAFYVEQCREGVGDWQTEQNSSRPDT
jgi:hypothetical protein